MHSHPVPAVDDGPETLDAALAMLRAAEAAGVTHIVATPHYAAAFDATAERVAAQFAALADAAAAEGIAIVLSAGREVTFTETAVRAVTADQRLCGRGRKPWVLIELPEGLNRAAVIEGMFALQLAGVTPVLAHPERHSLVVQDPALVGELRQRGALAQLDAGSIAGEHGTPVRRTAQRLLEQRWADAVASDAHGPRGYETYRGACERIARLYGSDYLQDLVSTGPARLINC